LRIIVGDEKCVYTDDSFADELLVKNYNERYGGSAVLLKLQGGKLKRRVYLSKI